MCRLHIYSRILAEAASLFRTFTHGRILVGPVHDDLVSENRTIQIVEASTDTSFASIGIDTASQTLVTDALQGSQAADVLYFGNDVYFMPVCLAANAQSTATNLLDSEWPSVVMKTPVLPPVDPSRAPADSIDGMALLRIFPWLDLL